MEDCFQGADSAERWDSSLPHLLPNCCLYGFAVLWGRIGSSEGFSGGSDVKNLPAMQETWVPSLGGEDALEKGMATHSSILTWEIPWTEESGGL